jgi:hypothetical protein
MGHNMLKALKTGSKVRLMNHLEAAKKKTKCISVLSNYCKRRNRQFKNLRSRLHRLLGLTHTPLLSPVYKTKRLITIFWFFGHDTYILDCQTFQLFHPFLSTKNGLKLI